MRTSASAPTAAMSAGSIQPIFPDPVGSTRTPCAIASRCLSITLEKNEGCRIVARQLEAASRRSIARWLPWRPVSSPAIGMFETFTIRSTPAASAASIALVSSST